MSRRTAASSRSPCRCSRSGSAPRPAAARAGPGDAALRPGRSTHHVGLVVEHGDGRVTRVRRLRHADDHGHGARGRCRPAASSTAPSRTGPRRRPSARSTTSPRTTRPACRRQARTGCSSSRTPAVPGPTSRTASRATTVSDGDDVGFRYDPLRRAPIHRRRRRPATSARRPPTATPTPTARQRRRRSRRRQPVRRRTRHPQLRTRQSPRVNSEARRRQPPTARHPPTAGVLGVAHRREAQPGAGRWVVATQAVSRQSDQRRLLVVAVVGVAGAARSARRPGAAPTTAMNPRALAVLVAVRSHHRARDRQPRVSRAGAALRAQRPRGAAPAGRFAARSADRTRRRRGHRDRDHDAREPHRRARVPGAAGGDPGDRRVR